MDIGNLSSTYTDMYQKASEASASRLEGKLKADYANATDEEMMAACKQFEAYFLEQVFKGMMKTIPKSEDSSSSDKTMLEFFQDQMIQSVAEQSTEQNGLGLAQMLYEQMKRNYGGIDPATLGKEPETAAEEIAASAVNTISEE